jgi:predicted transcriptional regulator
VVGTLRAGGKIPANTTPETAMKQTMTKAEKQATYDAWYIAEVEKGIADCDAGRVLPHEQVIAEARKHIEKTAKKHAQQAA